MSDLTTQTSATTFRWLREVPARDEVIRIDAEGFHYLGQFIADAGEAYQLLVEFLRKQRQAPVPVSEQLPGPVSDRQQQIEDLAADAVSALRYIEQSHGRLYGIGWDRVYEKADRLLPAHALPLPEVNND